MPNISGVLTQARINKKDEFYTSYEDVGAEMKNYGDYFRGKKLYFNCDDEDSNFWKYFQIHYYNLRIKSLIATKYIPHGRGEYFYFDDNDYIYNRLYGNGSFNSKECVELLRQCDCLITNPPFSKFRDYIDLLTKYKKDFILLGNLNALTYKNVIPLVKENKIWFGKSIHSGDRLFQVPDDYPLKGTVAFEKDGKKYIRVKAVRWYTNIPYDGYRGGISLIN